MPVEWIEANQRGVRRSGHYVVIDGHPVIGPYSSRSQAVACETGAAAADRHMDARTTLSSDDGLTGVTRAASPVRSE